MAASSPLLAMPSLPPIPDHPELQGARKKFLESNGEQMVLLNPAAGKAGEAGIWLLTMNRVKAKNGFSDAMYLAFADALNEAEKNEKVKVVIINANGDMFSSGADLRDPAGSSLKSGQGMACDPVGVFMRTLMRFPKVVVAAVNGAAIGVGCTLLPHCDVIYSTPNAYFWTPFTRIAVVPEFCSSYLFPKLMGTSVANEMLLFAKKLSAQRAKDIGFVSEIFPEGPNFLDSVINEIMAGMDYALIEKSLPLFKKIVKKSEMQILDQVFLYELAELDVRAEAGDILEAVSAFMAKEMAAKKSKKGAKL